MAITHQGRGIQQQHVKTERKRKHSVFCYRIFLLRCLPQVASSKGEIGAKTRTTLPPTDTAFYIC